MHAASCDFVGLFFLMLRRPPRSTLTAHSFPTRRSSDFDRDSVQSTADGGVSMIIHDKKNFVAGALYVSFGALVAIGSASYDLGTAQRMGPGYFQLALGLLLMGVGLLVAASALGAAGPRPDLRSEERRVGTGGVRTGRSRG